ncbi:MAG: helix-turn-helix domain-containing protein [Acidobacteria bacterium]|nr:helix-turn-helix domain-containing protein [Acidobacteriota bacterium]MCB1056458.1 helix-turn-helix domain-containing protein [Acidobacteriota bacterium]
MQSSGSKATSPFLDTRSAARYLLLSPKTLEKHRILGGGPKFRKHGRRVLYHLDDLNAWSEAQVRRSTSDPGSES